MDQEKLERAAELIIEAVGDDKTREAAVTNEMSRLEAAQSAAFLRKWMSGLYSSPYSGAVNHSPAYLSVSTGLSSSPASAKLA